MSVSYCSVFLEQPRSPSQGRLRMYVRLLKDWLAPEALEEFDMRGIILKRFIKL